MYALGAGVACALIGYMASRTLTMRVTNITQWLAALKRIETSLKGAGLSIMRVLEAGMAKDSPTVSNRLKETVEQMKLHPPWTVEQAWMEASKTKLSGERDAEKAILDQCFRDIGLGTIDQRQQGLSLAMERLALLNTEAREEERRNGRLYKSLGWLAGLALVLMLL